MKYVALKKTFKSIKKVDLRNAAEYAYALAMLCHRDGDIEGAIRFGREAITLFDKCQMKTMEDCAARNVIIEGIAIPDLIHQNVVRDRLKPLDLQWITQQVFH